MVIQIRPGRPRRPVHRQTFLEALHHSQLVFNLHQFTCQINQRTETARHYRWHRIKPRSSLADFKQTSPLSLPLTRKPTPHFAANLDLLAMWNNNSGYPGNAYRGPGGYGPPSGSPGVNGTTDWEENPDELQLQVSRY